MKRIRKHCEAVLHRTLKQMRRKTTDWLVG